MVSETTYLQRAWSRHLSELMQFLTIPSISADPAAKPALEEAAAWIERQLAQLGVPEVKRLDAGGPPAVYGAWHVGDDKPTVLIYGHYDVQPPDPLDEWQSPPFAPRVEGDRLYARGASDDKGNLFVPLKALEAIVQTAGAPPLNIKLLFEGEEEIGSPHLPALFERFADLLRADLVLCADGGMWSAEVPSLTIGSRGIAALQIDVRGPRSDLHSGTYGGAVRNPLGALARLLSALHDDEGRVAVPGFYEQVRPLSDAERALFAKVPFDEAAYKEELGVAALFGEPGYSPLERTWARPTIEISGMWGGYRGEGVKTVLPASAHAKLTCRLVPDQEPDAVLAAIERFIVEQAQALTGVTVSVTRFPGNARAYLMPAEHPVLTEAAAVLADVYGREPLVIRTGGTLPVADLIKSRLGVWFVFFSFGEPDNNIHGPNEFVRLSSLQRGMRAYVQLLQRLAALPPAVLREGAEA